MVMKKRMKGEEVLCGGWCPIKDEEIKDPRYDEIAKFAISEYNKHRNSKLKLETVVSGEFQVVQGMNFRLVVHVSDGEDGGSKTYETEVYEWMYSRVLNYFKPVN